MQPPNLFIFGGISFIGSQLPSRLVVETFSAPGLPGDRVIVPTRDPESAHAHNLALLPWADMMDVDIYADGALDVPFLALTERDTEYCAAINLVGVLQDMYGMSYGLNLQCVHVDLPRHIVAACRRYGVNRLLHMSALGTDPVGPSIYLRSKGDGERVVMNSELDWTVSRPSVMFGPQDYSLNLLVSMQHMVPFAPLACADARLQSVYMDDVTAASTNTLKKPATTRHAYPLVGPRVYTLAESMCFAGRASDHPRWIAPLPEGLGRIQTALLEHLSGVPISRGNSDSMRMNNVSMESVASEFGIHPFGMEAVMLPILAGFGSDRGLRAARTRVHRQSSRKHGAPASFVNMLHNRG